MLHRKVYYRLKPFIPWSVRMALRRWHAARIRKSHTSTWPINPAAGATPPNWRGWPDGKRFALVLTHDVEGRRGVERCHELMELEQGLGFRSSFNFVPEGEYSTPGELRDRLTSNGFEVGVHDFKHDGKLYFSRGGFQAQAKKIKEYLKQWNAVGFRAGFMQRNLEWLHDIGPSYDASTFDTDPFEIQPEGVNTIFPFWVPLHTSRREQTKESGYMELPYTLPQDSTLFILLKEKSPEIWKRKLDWIAANRGMALLIAHPDYMRFRAGECVSREYPAAIYEEFLRYVRDQYSGQYWMALPREVAQYARQMSDKAAFEKRPRERTAPRLLSLVTACSALSEQLTYVIQ
jgi:hypothetical protein